MTIISEKKHVKDVYDSIASDFSRTRTRIWRRVQNFLDDISDNSKCLDIGCGNGKNMLYANNRLDFKGIDNCEKFVKICKERNLNIECMDCCDLKFNDKTFDHIISIAVIHHMTTHKRRHKALSELIRVLKKNGTALISFWSFENQEKLSFSVGDNIVKWKHSISGKVYERFYHIYDEKNLKSFLQSFDSHIKILNIINEKGNWYVTFKKLSEQIDYSNEMN